MNKQIHNPTQRSSPFARYLHLMKETIPTQATNPTKSIITTSTINSRTPHSFLNKYFTIWTIPHFISTNTSRPYLQTIIYFTFLDAMSSLFTFCASLIFAWLTLGDFFAFFYVYNMMTKSTVNEFSKILSNETIILKPLIFRKNILRYDLLNYLRGYYW